MLWHLLLPLQIMVADTTIQVANMMTTTFSTTLAETKAIGQGIVVIIDSIT